MGKKDHSFERAQARAGRGRTTVGQGDTRPHDAHAEDQGAHVRRPLALAAELRRERVKSQAAPE